MLNKEHLENNKPNNNSNNNKSNNHVYEVLGDGTVLVDVRGSLCPIPVIETKVALEAVPGATVVTIVDNEVSRDNVLKFGQSRGRKPDVLTKGDSFYITLIGNKSTLVDQAQTRTGMIDAQDQVVTSVPEGNAAQAQAVIPTSEGSAVQAQAVIPASEGNAAQGISNEAKEAVNYGNKVLLVTKDYLGEGSEELGRTLMKTFWYCVSEASVKPKKIFFINSGVKMACEGSPHLENLKALAEAGVEIGACGICLDYYGIKDKVKVGAITNLYAITDAMMTEPMVTL